MYGLRVDYLSPTVYFIDVLIILYLFVTKASSASLVDMRQSPIVSLSPLVLINLLFSDNPLATLMWMAHLTLYVLFVCSLSSGFLRRFLIPALVGTISFQVVLGIVQIYLGHAVQGPLYWLGERALSLGSPNVAKAAIFGFVTLRSYGTFSHPNALAGWLTIALLIVNHLTLRKGDRKNRYVLPASVILTVCGIILAQSRAAAAALLGITIPFYVLRSVRARSVYLFMMVVFLVSFIHAGIFARSDLSVSERITLQRVSSSIIQANPFFGAGANAAISAYPAIVPFNRLLQPDHDSFTLLLSWFGISGILSLYFVFKGYRAYFQRARVWITVLLPLLPLLFLDHYLLTSPQGLFILVLYLRATSPLAL